MLLAGIAHLGIWFVVERHLPLMWSWPGVWATAYLTIPGTIVTFGGYYWLMQHMRVSSLNLIAYMSPVLALGLGFFFAQEPLTWTLLAGAALIFVGVALVGRQQQ